MNTRSLHRHAIDISNDQILLNTDVLCLTEAQLLPNQNTNNISEVLNSFDFLHNKFDDKFQSISFCYKSHVEMDSIIILVCLLYTSKKAHFHKSQLEWWLFIVKITPVFQFLS